MSRNPPIPFIITPEEADAFWARVVEHPGHDGCWEWEGSNSGGYGTFYVARLKRQLRAHRVAYVITHGPIPAGLYVLRRCDNPSCVNPTHLRAGTEEDNNNADKLARGRQPRRKRRGGKLTATKVKDIRRLAANGHTYESIARRFGVGPNCIGSVVRRESWKHVP